MTFLTNHFLNKGRHGSTDRLRRREWFIKARDERQKQKRNEEASDNDFLDFAAGTILATEIQLADFRRQLDSYDEATIRALELNQDQIEHVHRRLKEVRERLQDKLDRAFVIDDGRRVFRTEDGAQVFDEKGTAVTRDELDFDLIDPAKPSWESYKFDLEEERELTNSLKTLEQERTEFLQFQTKLDVAREELSTSDITEQQLEELDADLEALMPVSVKQQLPDYEPSAPVPSASTEFKFSADPSSLQKLRTSTADLRLERF